VSRHDAADIFPTDGAALSADPTRWADFTASATRLLGELVAGGAALGWLEPPAHAEVSVLLAQVAAAEPAGDGALRAAFVDGRLAGLGYWLRRTRPTHRPHADLDKLAVPAAARGRGIGRTLTEALIADARRARVEVLTLDARGDNTDALRLYRATGFVEYGRLPDFVAVGERRYDTVLCMLDLRERPAAGPRETPADAE